MSEENQACEVPLVEQLRSIPEDYRTVRAIQWSEDGRETGHQFIPVGFMMHRAAAEIERLRAAAPEGEPWIPEELYDGMAVYTALGVEQTVTIRPFMVSAVLDAVVRLIRKRKSQPPMNSGRDS